MHSQYVRYAVSKGPIHIYWLARSLSGLGEELAPHAHPKRGISLLQRIKNGLNGRKCIFIVK